jgi:secreted Zn-dependent insulinase-like peptidase
MMKTAELAGLSYDVKILARGVRLTFGGYNDKLKKFASFVSSKLSVRIQDLLPKDDKDFDRYKDQIMRALSAFDVSQPYSHASYYAQLTLQPRRFQYTNKELRDATRKTTLPDLVTYVKSLWSAGKGECLIQGNFNEVEALDLVSSIGDVLPFKPILENEYPPRIKALPLPASDSFTLPPRLLIAEPNPSQENSVSYVMLQSLGESEKDHVLMELLNVVVEEPFYNELRTKQQLGYIVASGIKGIAESRTLSFVVQSSVAPSNTLSLEILKFLDDVETKLLAKLPKPDLAVFVKSLIEKKTNPDKDLSVEVTRNWSEISSGRLHFDRLQREAIALIDIEKQDLLNFWQKLYVASGRRVLITEIIPRQGTASSQTPPTSTGYGRKDFPTASFILGIDDIEQFRRDRERLVDDLNVVDFPAYTL